jgi:hypothetical protein
VKISRSVAAVSVAAVSVIAGSLILALGPALSASADDSTTTTFSAASTQTVSYGTNWVMPVTVSGSTEYDFVTSTSGTVNILIKGIPGNYVTGLPLTPGGEAFFSPPSSKPPLPAGTYAVTAVYVPSGTAFLAASQTLTPATLTVTALNMTSSFTVNKTSVNNKPGLQVVVTVRPPNDHAAIPSGAWSVTAKDSTGAIAFQQTVPLAANPANPVTVTLRQKVKPGHQYTVSADFVPAATVAGGYQVKNGDPQKVTVEAQSLGEILSTPFAAPLWLLIAIGVGLALLVAAAIVFLVTTKRVDAAPTDPGDAQPAEASS